MFETAHAQFDHRPGLNLFDGRVHKDPGRGKQPGFRIEIKAVSNGSIEAYRHRMAIMGPVAADRIGADFLPVFQGRNP